MPPFTVAPQYGFLRHNFQLEKGEGILHLSANSKPTTEFAQPCLSRSRSDNGHRQRGGTNLGVFCFYMVTILATSYRSAEAPSRQKCRKSASESAGPKRGAEESAEKVLRPSRLCIAIMRLEGEALFRHFPRHPVWGRHFPKHFFCHFCRDGASALL